MKFALINGERQEATKSAKGICPVCDSPVLAKCGEVKIYHWAHESKQVCDHWWEPETDWHKTWKNHFPKDWHEFVQKDEQTGERHIADVKTPEGWTLEFQHSYLKPEERRARNAFYKKIVWIIDGRRRETDVKQFNNLKYRLVQKKPIIYEVLQPEKYRLIREWQDSKAIIIFDFHHDILWFLRLGDFSGKAYLSCFSKKVFIQWHNNGNFNSLFEKKK